MPPWTGGMFDFQLVFDRYLSTGIFEKGNSGLYRTNRNEDGNDCR